MAHGAYTLRRGMVKLGREAVIEDMDKSDRAHCIINSNVLSIV